MRVSYVDPSVGVTTLSISLEKLPNTQVDTLNDNAEKSLCILETSERKTQRKGNRKIHKEKYREQTLSTEDCTRTSTKRAHEQAKKIAHAQAQNTASA